MKHPLRKLTLALAVIGGLGAAQPALADGDVVCRGGPQANWQSLTDLRKRAWREGWEVLRVQIEGDCYEVYARTELGQAIEAFFHPVTLEKLVVFRRGREIFRKEGFTG